MEKIVLTGGRHVGKSTVVAEFSRENYRIVEGSFSKIQRDLGTAFGVDFIQWYRRSFPFQYIEFALDYFLMKEQQAQIGIPEHDLLIYDRGILDFIVFCIDKKIALSDKLLREAENIDYKKAFLFHFIEAIQDRPGVDPVDKEISQKIETTVRRVYGEYRVKLIDVPVMPVPDRVNFVKKNAYEST